MGGVDVKEARSGTIFYKHEKKSSLNCMFMQIRPDAIFSAISTAGIVPFY